MKHVPHASSFENVLVTGGAGFIGGHLLAALVAAGTRPTAITRRASNIENLPDAMREQVRWIELDLLNSAAVRELMKELRPSVLFHLAGTRGKEMGENAEAACHELNVRATLNLLESSEGIGRAVIVGSADEYGRQAGQLKESHPTEPTSVYGASKAEATRLAQDLHERANCPVVILRPFTVYGPRQPRWMFVAEAIECAVNGTPFKMSAGTQRRDLVYVSDVVRALMSAAHASSVEGKLINIASGRAERLIDVARLIWQLSESRAPLLVGERPATPEEMHDTWADISLAGELLDWKPLIGIEEGLRETIEWTRVRFLQGQQKELTNWL